MRFENIVLFLWPWTPNKPIQLLQLDAVSVWVKFLKLRAHYFNSYVLRGLDTLIEKSMFVDRLIASQSVSYAKNVWKSKLESTS